MQPACQISMKFLFSLQRIFDPDQFNNV
jgi:hypothetical protein